MSKVYFVCFLQSIAQYCITLLLFHEFYNYFVCSFMFDSGVGEVSLHINVK